MTISNIKAHFAKILHKNIASARQKKCPYHMVNNDGKYAYKRVQLLNRHYEFISKFNIRLKSLLNKGLSEPEFYGDLGYKFKKVIGGTDFSDQLRKIIIRHKCIGYDLNVMQQSACLVINPITADNFAALFNCMIGHQTL